MKKTKLDENVTPIFEGTLDREAFAQIMEQKFSESGMSQREFCETYGFQRSLFNRIRGGTATIDTSLGMLSKLGVKFDFSAFD